MKKHDILELSKMSHEDLLGLADEHGIDHRGLSKQVLMYEILDKQKEEPTTISTQAKEVTSNIVSIIIKGGKQLLANLKK